ncbi:MAG: hypothetical protein KF869_12695 [Phycisphaeraceae bacterium]|nr:hypothetical protein [Phycisphaeraceae bacterium]
MSGPRERVSERLEAYADGALGAADRADFEREMLRDPALRAEVEMQERINDRLRALYAPPESVAVPALAGSAKYSAHPTHAPPAPRRWVGWALGIAAAIALAFVGIQYTGLLGPGPGDTRADALYTRLVRMGFEPAWECKDDAEFIAYTRDKFGQAFTIDPTPGVTLLGWTYCTGVLGDQAGVLLVDAGGEKVIVVVDRAGQDRPVKVDGASGLRVIRQRAGNAVLYEVTPRQEAVVLPHVQVQ